MNGLPPFWKSAGLHLTEAAENGWRTITPDYLRAYFTRPEIHPVEESCEAERRLHDALLTDPYRAVTSDEIASIADPDARDGYKIILTFRDLLVKAGTVEGAYLSLFGGSQIAIPPVIIDQMVHLILANVLTGTSDPMQMRAGELFFRLQNVNIDDEGRVMFADDEIVETFAETGGMGSLGQLLAESNTPMRQVSLDVLDDENSAIYWERSERFDTVIDIRFTQPALDALARVIEKWIKHFKGLKVRVRPVSSIKDERWSWHIGLDAQSTDLLNTLYNGEDLGPEDLQRLLALLVLEVEDRHALIPTMKGKPIYLGLGMSTRSQVRMKPQNLLVSLPLKAAD